MIVVKQNPVPIVFARAKPVTPPLVARTLGDFKLASFKDILVSPNIETGDGLFYDKDLKKWISQPVGFVLQVLDGGTY